MRTIILSDIIDSLCKGESCEDYYTALQAVLIEEINESMIKSLHDRQYSSDKYNNFSDTDPLVKDTTFSMAGKGILSVDQLEKIAVDMANFVAEKNRAYGNSAVNSTKIIQILYPNGVAPEQYQDMLLIIRVLDKLNRIATDKTALSESPWKDILGYALIAVANEESDD